MELLRRLRQWRPQPWYTQWLSDNAESSHAMSQLWSIYDAASQLRANAGTVCAALGSGFLIAFVGAALRIGAPDITCLGIVLCVIMGGLSLLAGAGLIMVASDLFDIARKIPYSYAEEIRRCWIRGERQ